MRPLAARRREGALWLLSACLFLCAAVSPPARAGAARQLLVTVDDLPLSASELHPEPAERRRITEGLLAALARHRIRAVGFVTWSNVRDDGDLALLESWLEAGHELGNHTVLHLDYSRTDVPTFVEDAESARQRLEGLLSPRGRIPRFFRFPLLHEGETAEKLEAMRTYLARSGQRNLPVTIDTTDWSFERSWVESRGSGDEARLEAVRRDYLATLRVAVNHHERTGDGIFGRELPQILLLHANEVGSALWDELFDSLTSMGHRFTPVDDVLSDPIFGETQAYAGEAGLALWDRFEHERRVEEAGAQVAAVLDEQIEAWNRGDLEGFCSHYAADALFLSPVGMVRGRRAVLDRYRSRYGQGTGMGALSLEILETRPAMGLERSMLGDAAPGSVQGVSVAARWRLEYPDKEPVSGLTLLVFGRIEGRWMIVQDASM